MHSHHSHSGEYISHASGKLDDMVATAEARGFTHFCLTEHMPRFSNEHLYPEELDKNYSVLDLEKNFRNYLVHARKLQHKYNSQCSMQLLVGFEVEGIDEQYIEAAKQITAETDMCVGSVHYVHGIPIDFNRELWLQARAACADGSTRCLYRDYFDLQYKVISELRPEVIGHFDLIRLFDEPETDANNESSAEIDLKSDWPEVWEAIQRNIELVVSYGGLFELNSAAVRKGWSSPYPKADVALAIKDFGGRFCLSDDSHTIPQVALNYHVVWKYITEILELESLFHLEIDQTGNVITVEQSVSELSNSPFWKIQGV